MTDVMTSQLRTASRRLGTAGTAPWLATTLLAGAIGSAYAQSTPAADQKGAASPAAPASAAASRPSPQQDPRAPAVSELDTVTVSATRRRELVREVPLSVSSIPADRLAEIGARSLNDYLATQPGVILQNSGTIDNSGSIVIRGLTTGNDTNAPTTVYLDDVPLAIGAPFDINLLDLRRFEILRGPQGTLYGSSAMGGILKYITNDPDTSSVSGVAGIGLSKTHHGGFNREISGVVNVPVRTDVLALRIAAFDRKDPGYVDATGPAARDGVNQKESHGGRFTAFLTPDRRLEIRFTAMGQVIDSDGNDRISYDLASRQPASGDLVYLGLYVAEPRKSRRELYSATVDYDLGFARLSSITARQHVSDNLITDFTPLAGLFGLSTGFATDTVSNRKTTQEFRLVSQTAGAFQWLVGAFLDNVDLRTDETLAGTAGPAPVVFGVSGDGRRYRERALYGNLTWNATDSLAFTGGLRVARVKQTDIIEQQGAPTKVLSFQETPKTYLATAKYRLTPQSNVYVRAANGYRPGGANPSSVDMNNVPVPGAPPSYGTDKAWTYEAGYKASDPVTGTALEVAVFDTEWKDLQQFTQGVLIGFTSNLGKARVRGVEASAGIRPLRSLSLGVAASFLDAKLLTDSPGLGGKEGDRLPSSPRIAVGANARYTYELAGLPAYATAYALYQGARNSSFEGSPLSPNFKLPSYVQLDLASGVKVGSVDVGVYVRNLTDKRGLIGANTSEQSSVGRTYARVITPRTIGVNLSASF